jgi:hypothetical protein
MKRLLFFLLCTSPAYAYFPAVVSVCNNTPKGNGIACYAGTSSGASSTSTAVSYSGFPSSSTVFFENQVLIPPFWAANAAYSPGTQVIDSNGNIQQVTTGGTSGSSAPSWNTSGTTTDNTVVWTFQRIGRLDPTVLATDVSDTLHSTWTLVSSGGSGALDGNIVRGGIWYALIPASTTATDTITTIHPDSQFIWAQSLNYTGLGVIRSTQPSVLSWNGIVNGGGTTGNFPTTIGDLTLANIGVSPGYPGCGGWNAVLQDATKRQIFEDQIVTSTTSNATAFSISGVDGFGASAWSWAPEFPNALNFATNTMPFAQQGVVYASTPIFIIANGTAPYTCSTISGSVPAGLSITTSGKQCLISGTPTVNGDFSWTEQVADNNGGTYSGNAYLVISTPTLPNFTSVSVTPYISSATVNWTSNVNTNSQVCFSTSTTAQFVCPFPTDGVSGTTSHSVVITNVGTTLPYLTAGTTYTFYLYEQGFFNTVLADFIQNTSSTMTFTTLPAASGGGASMTYWTNGPFDVAQGSTMTVPQYISVNTDTAGFTSLTIHIIFTATDEPDGAIPNAQVHWPYQQDLGMNGTVSSYLSTNDTLTYNNYADVLNYTPFQIITNVGGTTPVGNYLLEPFATLQPGGATSAFVTQINVYPPGQQLPSYTCTPPVLVFGSGGGGGGGSSGANDMQCNGPAQFNGLIQIK